MSGSSIVDVDNEAGLQEGEHRCGTASRRKSSIGYVRAELFRVRPIPLAVNKWTNSPAWNLAIDEPIPGYALEDCLGVSGDTTDGVMRWKGGAGIRPLSGEMIVVRFELSNAALYAFWLDAPTITR
ncbi:MAG: hypothetical protein FJY97_06980 [candidate division Zixibacteria bacterium]|nr:hypothetical protein [candidate division Zixibacteria bacterium]